MRLECDQQRRIATNNDQQRRTTTQAMATDATNSMRPTFRLFYFVAMTSTVLSSMTCARVQGCNASPRGRRNVPHVSHVLPKMPLGPRSLRESRQLALHIVSAKKKKGGKKGGDASEEPVVETSKVRGDSLPKVGGLSGGRSGSSNGGGRRRRHGGRFDWTERFDAGEQVSCSAWLLGGHRPQAMLVAQGHRRLNRPPTYPDSSIL